MVNPLARRAFLQPVDKSFAEVVRVRALGRASLLTDVAWAAAKQYCALYNKSPSTVVKLVPFGDSFIDEGKGIFDEMCEPHSPPPPYPLPPYSGGQCDNVAYNVRIDCTERLSNGTGSAVERSIQVGDFLRGPIESVRLSPVVSFVFQNATITGSRFILVRCRGSSFQPATPVQDAAIGTGNNNSVFTALGSISITRPDGLPDSCGSPSPSYPPPSATADDLSGTTIINIAPGVNATVPVVIIPTLAPVVGIFRPEFNVNVGGINVNISTGGFTFSPFVSLPIGNTSPYFDPRTVIPVPIPIDSPPSAPSTPTDLTPILDKVKELKDEVIECCDRLNPFEAVPTGKFIVTALGSGNSGSFQLPARSFRVVLTLTSDPATLKQQSGDNAPTVFYAGWVWFEVDGGMMERMPIDALTKAYETPSRATGKFAFKLYKDYTCSINVRSSVKPT